MISGNRARLLKDHDAVKNDLALLLYSDKLTLFGDPNFGTALRNAIFENDSTLLYDLVVDELLSVLITYMPTITVERDDISVSVVDNVIVCKISCRYNDTGEYDLFDIALTSVGTIES